MRIGRPIKNFLYFFLIIHSFVCWLQWYDALSLIMMKRSCTNSWSLEYISLIYLYKHHYLLFLYKSKDLFSAITDCSPYVYFYAWFHYKDIVALAWSNPSSISNWNSIESCFVCKKISWFSIQAIFCKINTLLFNRSLRCIVKTVDFSYL